SGEPPDLLDLNGQELAEDAADVYAGEEVALSAGGGGCDVVVSETGSVERHLHECLEGDGALARDSLDQPPLDLPHGRFHHGVVGVGTAVRPDAATPSASSGRSRRPDGRRAGTPAVRRVSGAVLGRLPLRRARRAGSPAG